MYGFMRVEQGESREVAELCLDPRTRRTVDHVATVLEDQIGGHAPPSGVEEEVIGRGEDPTDGDVGGTAERAAVA